MGKNTKYMKVFAEQIHNNSPSYIKNEHYSTKI